MPKPNLRVIENDREHAREIAKREIKRFRAEEKVPISNQYDSGAPSLRTDDVLDKSQPDLLGKK